MQDFIHDKRVYYSPVEFAMAYIGGTWKIPVILALANGPLRYGDLKNAIAHVTDKMLNTQLRDLEKECLPVPYTAKNRPASNTGSPGGQCSRYRRSGHWRRLDGNLWPKNRK